MLVIGIAAWVAADPGRFLVRAGAARRRLRRRDAPARHRRSTLTAAQALRTPQFVALALTHFACCAAHSGPIFHMVTYAIGCGIAADGGGQRLQRRRPRRARRPPAARRAGRPVRRQAGAGRRPDGAGAGRRRPISRSASSASSMRSSVVFGLAYGGVMPLYAMLVREYFGARIMGTVFGAVSACCQPRHGARPVGRRLGVRQFPAATPGSTSARSPSGSPPWRWR